MQHEIKIGLICWIKADPHPLTSPALQAGLLSPTWIPKTLVGLVATANTPPPPMVNDFTTLGLSINHRSMIYCRLIVDIDEKLKKVTHVTAKQQFISSGWTPPFKASRLSSTIMSVASNFVSSMNDPTPHEGEKSPISTVVCQSRHRNSAIASTPSMKTVIANGLVKFRAGEHTDRIGIKEAGSPFHVPWVWSEFLLSYADGTFELMGRGSVFPTHSWYIQGKQVMTQSEVSDGSFPTEGILGRSIVTKALNVYPALSTGAPASGSQAALSEAPVGAVSTHPYTVTGGETRSYSFKL